MSVMAAVLLFVLVVLAVLTSAVAAQSGDFELVAVVEEVSGDNVTIVVSVDPRGVSLGALEGSLVFDPEVLSPKSCDFAGDLGACNPLEDRLRFSALFIDGLDGPRNLMTATFSARADTAETTVDFADVAGFDTTTAPLIESTTSAELVTGTGSTNPLFIALPMIALVALGAVGALRAKNRKD